MRPVGKRKAHVAAGLVLAALLAVTHRGPAAEAGQANWALGTSSSGSGPYQWGSAIANVVNRHQSVVRIFPQVTAGYNENLALVAAGRAQLGMTTASDYYAAFNTIDRFAGRNEFKNLRRLFVFGVSTTHIVVRADSDIYKFRDLRGKRFNIDPPGTATRFRNEALIKAYGMSLSDFRIYQLSTTATFQALQDRVIDATSNGYGIGHPPLRELASQVPIRLLEVEDDAYERLNQLQYGTLIRVVIPGGVYRGQDTNVKTFGSPSVIFTHKDADPELVYAFVKSFWDNLEELKTLDQAFRILDLSMAVEAGGGTPLHPGAERYFREVGVLR